MRNTADRSNLYASMVEHEMKRHRCELERLKRAESLISQLSDWVPKIEALGASVTTSCTVYGVRNDRSLAVHSGGLFSSAEREKKLLDVLIGLGFKVCRTTAYPTHTLIYMQRGRLRIVHTQGPAGWTMEPTT